MKKVFKKICIKPIDEQVQMMAQSAKIINEFKGLGFTERSAFVNIVTDKKPEYLTIEMLNKLNTYWAGRVRDEDLNNSLLIVLEKLKDE